MPISVLKFVYFASYMPCCLRQVRNLRPGRRYAYKIVIKPHVVPPWADLPEQAPSAAEVYETPATVPMPPKPIKCTRRERAAFEVYSSPMKQNQLFDLP